MAWFFWCFHLGVIQKPTQSGFIITKKCSYYSYHLGNCKDSRNSVPGTVGRENLYIDFLLSHRISLSSQVFGFQRMARQERIVDCLLFMTWPYDHSLFSAFSRLFKRRFSFHLDQPTHSSIDPSLMGQITSFSSRNLNRSLKRRKKKKRLSS